MSDKIRFILNNEGDNSTLTLQDGTAVAGLPVTNIQDLSRSKVFRTTDTTNVEIRGKFSATQDISSVVLGRHNFPSGVQWSFTVYSDEWSTSVGTTGTQTVSSEQGAATPYLWGDFNWGSVPWGEASTGLDFDIPNNLVYWNLDGNGDELLWSNVLTWSITIQLNTAVGINYFELGRVFIGNFLEPTFNMSFGHGLTWKESTKQFRTQLGTLRSERTTPYRQMDFDLRTIAESDREELMHGFRNVGLRKDIYMSYYPSCTTGLKKEDYSGIVKLTKIPKYIEFVSNYYRSKYVMEEV